MPVNVGSEVGPGDGNRGRRRVLLVRLTRVIGLDKVLKKGVKNLLPDSSDRDTPKFRHVEVELRQHEEKSCRHNYEGRFNERH